MRGIELLIAMIAWTLTPSVRAEEVLVAVAANFAAPMEKIAADFARSTGHAAVLAFGSTGKLYAQIVNGAPFQVLLAADETTPGRLEREGRAEAGTRRTYANGRLALWSARPGVVDAQGDVLRTGAFQHISLADPETAPYGAAALEVLTRLGVLQALTPKFVKGENITQAYQFVATGNAELGFVALSQIIREGRLSHGSAWTVPAELYPPLRQDAVLLLPGRGKAGAAALLQYLNGDAARAVILSYGYSL